jgi:hypothetical protein
MITRLELTNYKCFKKHELPLRETTVIVGRNNAGKSTLVEAIRLVALVAQRYPHLNYYDAPDWSDLPAQTKGVSPSMEGIRIDLENVFYQYGSPPAWIRATFSNHASVEVYLGPNNQVFGVVRDKRGRPVANKREAQSVRIKPVTILPQVRPLAREETILTRTHVLDSISSSLCSLHFRNQLKLFANDFPKFKRLAERTWHGLEIVDLEGKSDSHGDPIALLVRDGNFTAEIGWMGHGLQMWLQVMWFLARVGSDDVIILDEPDVYMHADLQRKLIRELSGHYAQTIVATHSVEILSEVEPENVLIVDHRRPQSDFAPSLPAVQRAIEYVGGVHNLQLARLWNAKKCLLLEGDDLSLLRQFQNTLFPKSNEPFDTIPCLPIGGWGGWNYAIGSSMLIHNAVHERIRVYCILDRDYHTQKDIETRYEQARERGVDLHIWERKELENYLLIPSAIQRAIQGRLPSGDAAPSIGDVEGALNRISDSLYDETLDSLGADLLAFDKHGGFANANRAARARLVGAWSNLDGKLAIVSGKKVIAGICTWSQEQCGASISYRLIARSLVDREIPAELRAVISAIEGSHALGCAGLAGSSFSGPRVMASR